MATFTVSVSIENKPGISDPEGATILNDLVLKGEFESVKSIRTAKMLKFTLDAESENAAIKEITKLCDEMRIYNPLVSKTMITVD